MIVPPTQHFREARVVLDGPHPIPADPETIASPDPLDYSSRVYGLSSRWEERGTMRIAVGGLHTECSTFNSALMDMQDFRILRGAALLAHPEFRPLQDFAVDWMPLLHARAVPGAPIRRAAYDAFKREFLDALRAALPIDGLYLAMHGAANVEGMDDAEGDWIEAARAVVGPDCPISCSFDLHGSISQREIDTIDMFTAYRTAPHIDVEDTKRRACAMLVACLESGRLPHVRWVKVPVLLSGESTSTVDEPARSLYARLPGIDAVPGISDASIMVGYLWGDEPRATAAIVMTGTDPDALDREGVRLAREYWDARYDFHAGCRTGTTEECLDWALAAETRPAILAESGDNPTAGGVGDRADLLRELLARGATETLIAGIADRPATMRCYEAGIGARISLTVGGTLDPRGSEKVRIEAEILFLAETAELAERQAVIRSGGVTLVLTARRRPFHEIEDFAALGLDPRTVRLLVVKSGYLAPALAPLAAPNVMAISPGAVDQDFRRLRRHRIERPIFPFDTDFTFEPKLLVSARYAAGRDAAP